MKVLIIGNGIAGMSAAIEAAELDDEVILVSPVQSERTQSVMAAEGINAVVDTAEEDSVVWHANDTLESGCFLEKEEDVRNLCEKAPEHLKWLDEMGVLFDRNEDDTWKVKASGGQSRKRTDRKAHIRAQSISVLFWIRVKAGWRGKSVAWIGTLYPKPFLPGGIWRESI